MGPESGVQREGHRRRVLGMRCPLNLKEAPGQRGTERP